ncbi:MAG TPA: hypothetical protein VIW92_07435, partial [Thermoanaerobaculia bacterium]
MPRSGVPPEILEALREDIVPAAIGFVICGIALAALALALVRRRSRNLALIDLACLAGLYGVRLLADTSAAELLFGLPPAFLERFTNVVTYLVTIPATLFFENMIGSGWRSSMRWLRWAFIGLAVVAVPAEVALPEPGTFLLPYRFLVITSVLLMVAHLFWPGRRGRHLRWLRGSLAVLSLFVINENLQDIGWMPWEADLEAVGFLLFLGGLGIAAAHGLLDSQERLGSLRQELETARQIQASTLPQKTPDIAGLDLAA